MAARARDGGTDRGGARGALAGCEAAAGARTDPWATPPDVPVVVRSGDPGFPAATVQRMLAQGLLLPIVGDVLVAAGDELSREARAAALATVVPSRAVVARVAAAWVHLGGPAPRVVDLLGLRTRQVPHQRWAAAGLVARVHGAPPPEHDVVVLAGLRVTTAARTAADVARWCDDEEVDRLLPCLLPLPGAGVAAARAVVATTPGGRGVHRAREALDAASPSEAARREAPRQEVTR